MQPLTTVRTTATAGQEGRLVVDTGGKKGFVKRYIANKFPGRKGGKTRFERHDGAGGPGLDLSSSQGVAKAISDVNALSTRDKILKTQVSKVLGATGGNKKTKKIPALKTIIKLSKSKVYKPKSLKITSNYKGIKAPLQKVSFAFKKIKEFKPKIKN